MCGDALSYYSYDTIDSSILIFFQYSSLKRDGHIYISLKIQFSLPYVKCFQMGKDGGKKEKFECLHISKKLSKKHIKKPWSLLSLLNFVIVITKRCIILLLYQLQSYIIDNVISEFFL